MEQVSEAISKIQAGSYRPTSPSQSMPQQESGLKKSGLLPLIRTEKTPDDIIFGYFDNADLEAMTKFLSDRQKSEAEWETFRRKIPDDLLSKWRQILNECWRNGFCGPSVRNNQIVWKQIKALPDKSDAIDECSLCTNTFKAGTCRGRGKLKMQSGEFKNFFKPCWEK